MQEGWEVNRKRVWREEGLRVPRTRRRKRALREGPGRPDVNAARTSETGICTMHNFNFVPGIASDILVSAAYTGGTTVADLTDPANPVEIGYYKAGDPIAANTWWTYWHNGFIYANAIARGFDVFSISDFRVAGAANLFRDNPQTQERLFP